MNNDIDLNAQDSANRERALAHTSFIVEAPAGAGKTELLTQRYLKLLASVHEPEEIIALTFTNKAAAEMRNRILLSLEHAQQQTPETAAHKLITRKLALAALQQSNQQQWDILNQPSRLRILTIDALCSSLTRQMPLLSKFGGQPQVSDDTETLYLEAARRAIAHIALETEPDAAVTSALRYLDNNSDKLMQLLAKMLARRDQWLPLATQMHTADATDLSRNIEIAVEHLISQALDEALTILPASEQRLLMPLARYAASNLGPEAEIAPLLDWEFTLTADAADLVQWQAVSSFLVTKSERSYRKSLNKNNGFLAEKEHKDKKDAYFAVVARLESSRVIAAITDLPVLTALADTQPIMQALTRLLVLAASHLWAVFQANGAVDFVAISQSAQLALENEHGVTDLALKLDYQISHLLIDEFQDTSPVQMRLIEKLIEGWQPDDGRTLFCVGDPMQSIYRFRKADVSLFLQAAQEGIGHLPLTRLQLSRNNRSHPAVVNWINHAFAQVFPASDNINQGAISYRQFTATRASVTDEGVIVHALLLDSGNDDAADDTAINSANAKQLEAHYVAELIVKLRAQAVAGQKIAVLVRSRSHLQELVSAIRRHHPTLHFQALEIEQLNDRQTVLDAFSLMCALSHRADRVHWLNLLRAPWCGLTLADLHRLAADNHRATIWQLMHDDARLQNFSADGLVRLNHVKAVLTAAFSAQGRMPLRRWLESTWLQLGGGKCLLDAGDNRDVQVFFDLVEKMSRSGHVDIAALELGMQKLYAKPDMEADGSLQFLTIHKSKGLEFDTVIVPALNRPPKNPDHELVLWQEVMVDGHLHLIAAPYTAPNKKSGAKTAPSVYQFLKDLEAVRSDNEIVRLLYVAATRAERQLHLIGSVQTNKKGEIKPAARSLLRVLWPAVAAEFSQASVRNIETGSQLDIAQFQSQLQRLAIADLALPDLAPSADTMRRNPASTNTLATESASHALPVTSLQVTNTLATNALDAHVDDNWQRHCGTLAHLYMQLLARSDLNLWNRARLQQCLPAMQKWLLQQGHTSALAESGASLVLAALQTTLASADGQWLLQAHSQGATELSLMQLTHGMVKHHIIDRTFVDQGIRWIIDYKLTATAADAVLTPAHSAQLARYAALFSAEGLPIKSAIFFLSSGRLQLLL